MTYNRHDRWPHKWLCSTSINRKAREQRNKRESLITTSGNWIRKNLSECECRESVALQRVRVCVCLNKKLVYAHAYALTRPNTTLHIIMHDYIGSVRKHRFACIKRCVCAVPTDSNRRQTNTKHQKYFDSNKVPIGFSRQTANPPAVINALLIRSSRQALSLWAIASLSVYYSFFYS